MTSDFITRDPNIVDAYDRGYEDGSSGVLWSCLVFCVIGALAGFILGLSVS